MERAIKGGYILISLGLIALSTSYSGSIDYDRVSKTKKHIVLTGIKVGDTIMPDVTVKPIYGNGTITFEDVYGFDIVISSNNSVTVSEHVAPSGGTKLYKHTLSINSSVAFQSISFITNIEKKLSESTSETDFIILSGDLSGYGPGTNAKIGYITDISIGSDAQGAYASIRYFSDSESSTVAYHISDITTESVEAI